jgi:hypothetical protein
MSPVQILNLNLDSTVIAVGLVCLLIAAARTSTVLPGQVRRQLLVAISLLILSVLLGSLGNTVQSLAVAQSRGMSTKTLESVTPIVSLLFFARVLLLLVSVSILAFLVVRRTDGAGGEQELHQWSWGAFVLAPVWGVFNRTYIGLLALVPILGFYVAIYLGIYGRELAWNRSEKQADDFRRRQTYWDRAGLTVFLFALVLLFVRFWPQ